MRTFAHYQRLTRMIMKSHIPYWFLAPEVRDLAERISCATEKPYSYEEARALVDDQLMCVHADRGDFKAMAWWFNQAGEREYNSEWLHAETPIGAALRAYLAMMG
jgi:hypothetical protein